MTKIEFLQALAKGWFGNSQQHATQAQMLKQRGFGKLADRIQNDTGFESICLRNQICFPLYACAKEVIRQYVYDLAEHDGVAFEDLPEDWRCPRCKQPKEKFNKA